MTQFAFPLLGINSGYATGQDGWKAGYDANMAWLYMAALGRVLNRTLTTLPGSPTVGDAYIVAPSGTTGALIGKENQVVVRGESTWYYMPAAAGVLTFYDVGADEWVYFDGTAWTSDLRLENDIGLRHIATPTFNDTGTTELTRAESAAPAIIIISTATETITMKHVAANLDAVPALQYVINYFCAYPVQTLADAEPGPTVPVAGGVCTAMLAHDGSPGSFIDGAALFGLAFLCRAIRGYQYYGSGSDASYTLAESDSGGLMWFDDNTQQTELVLPTSHASGLSGTIWRAFCTSPEGVKITPQSGVISGYDADLILTEGEFALIRLDGAGPDYEVVKGGSAANSGGAREYSSSSPYTLNTIDLNRILDCTNSAEMSITVPPASTTDFGPNAVLHVRAGGAGGVTLVPGSGVTLTGCVEIAEGEIATIKRKDKTNTWYVKVSHYGDARGRPITVNTATSYNLVKGDKGRINSFTNGSPITVTIDPASTTDMGEDCELWIFVDTAAGLTIAAGAGVTLKGITAPAQNQLVKLRRVGTSDTWWSVL